MAGLVGYLEQTLKSRPATAYSRMSSSARRRAQGRVERAREEISQLLEQILERARMQGSLRPDFTLADLTLLFWSFATLIDATAAVKPTAWRRHLHWLLDGLRTASATAQDVPPLSDEQLRAAVQALRAQRAGRRAGVPPAASPGGKVAGPPQ